MFSQKEVIWGVDQEETKGIDEAGIPDWTKKLGRMWQDKKTQKYKERIRQINWENLRLVFVCVK